jgi:hypothetical protein
MSIASEMTPEQLDRIKEQQERAINPYRGAFIAPYSPDRSVIKEFAERLRGSLTYKNASKLSQTELVALAHASLATGLNPYLGEIWAIPDLGLMIGRAGWVKKLGEMAERQKFVPMHTYRLLQHNEYPEYSVPDDAKIAFMCELRRSDWNKIYTDTLKDLSESMKLDYEIIIDLLGKPPVIRGVGFIRKDENFGNSAMPLADRAKKRAFTSACKEIVYLPFETFSEGDTVNGQIVNEPSIVDGEFKVTEEHAPHADPHPTQEEKKLERPASPEALRDYVRSRGDPAGPGYEAITDKQAKIANGLIKGLFKSSATQNADAQSYLEFVAAASHVADISKKTASVLIDLIKSEEKDDWSPSQVAVDEAARVLRDVYVEEGQIEMPLDGDETTEDEIVAPEPEVKPSVSVSAQVAAPSTEVKMPLPTAPEPQPAPKKAEPKARSAAGKKPFVPMGSSYKKVELKADQKPPEPIKDNGEDVTILALKRSNPSTWVMGAEMLNKELKTKYTGGSLREAVLTAKGMKFFDTLMIADGWQVAVELAQVAAATVK